MALDLPFAAESDGLHFSINEASSTYDGESLDYATGTGAVLMAGSYRQCDACGKRALSIAIRCPGCGREFPARIVPKEGGLELGRFIRPKAVAALLAIVAVLVSSRLGRAGQPTEVRAEVESSMGSTGPLDTARVAELPAESGSDLRVARSLTDVGK